MFAVGLLLLAGAPAVWWAGQFGFANVTPGPGCVGDRWDCVVTPRQAWRWRVGPLVQIVMAAGAFVAWASLFGPWVWKRPRVQGVVSGVGLAVLVPTAVMMTFFAVIFFADDCAVQGRGVCVGGRDYAMIFAIPAVVAATLIVLLTTGLALRFRSRVTPELEPPPGRPGGGPGGGPGEGWGAIPLADAADAASVGGRRVLTGTLTVWTGLVLAQFAWLAPYSLYW